MLCPDCAGQAADVLPFGQSALYALQFIEGTPVEKLYTFTVSDDVLAQLKKAAKRCVEGYIGHTFRSLEMLEMI